VPLRPAGTVFAAKQKLTAGMADTPRGAKASEIGDTNVSTATPTKTPSGWTLDDVINHEVHVLAAAKSMAAMPSLSACKEAEEFYVSELFFTPTKATKDGERTWKIDLPAESGRKTRWGMTLLLVEKNDIAEFSPVSLLVYVSRLRRLVQPRYVNWRSSIPFIGTFISHLLKKERGLAWFPNGHADLEKYTKSA